MPVPNECHRNKLADMLAAGALVGTGNPYLVADGSLARSFSAGVHRRLRHR